MDGREEVMININKKEKTYLLLIVIVLMFTAISTLILTHNRKTSLHKEEISRLTDEYKKTITPYENMKVSAVENTKDKDVKFDVNDNTGITELFLDIDKIINNKDFDKLLSYYNKQYVEEFKITKEQIEEKFHFEHEISSKINIKHDKSIKDRVIVTVRMMNKFNQERIFDFTIFNDGTISDMPLFKEIKLDRVTERDGTVYTLKKKYITRLGSIYIVNVTNNSEYLVDIQEINGYLGENRFDHELIGGNIYTYKITPTKSVDLIIKIFNQEKIDNLEIINKRYDGTLDKFNLLEGKRAS